MITIRIDMTDFTLDMEGHAGAPREGEFDLVCCAASTIAQMLLHSIENYNDRHNGIRKIDEEIDKGRLHIRIRAKEWARPAVISRMHLVREGLEMLQERYPEYIQIAEEA